MLEVSNVTNDVEPFLPVSLINVNTSSHGKKLDLENFRIGLLQIAVNMDIKGLIFSWFYQLLEFIDKSAEICTTTERLQAFEQWKVML